MLPAAESRGPQQRGDANESQRKEERRRRGRSKVWRIENREREPAQSRTPQSPWEQLLIKAIAAAAFAAAVAVDVADQRDVARRNRRRRFRRCGAE